MHSLSHPDYRASGRFTALDGLRAVTVLSLIGLHYGFGALQPLVGKGKITVFFVLSGFVITLLLLRDNEKYGRIRLREFYVRRQFRLLPAFYTVLVATAICRYAVPATGPNDGDWAGFTRMLPYFLTFTHEWGPSTTDITTFVHSWTLAYEQKFYLVWPLVFAALTRWAPRHRLTATIALCVLCLGLIPLVNVRFVQYFALLLGCVLGLLLHEERTYRLLRPLTHPIAAVPVAAGFLWLHVWIGQHVKDPHEPILAWYALGVAVLLVTLLGSGPVRWLLNLRFFQFVGQRGYAMYLIHGLAGAAVVALAPQWGDGSMKRTLLIAVVTIVFADALYRFVELPGAALGRRFLGWLDEGRRLRDERRGRPRRTVPRRRTVAATDEQPEPVRT